MAAPQKHEKHVGWWDDETDKTSWLDALRARPSSARDILLGAGYSYDGPDLVAEVSPGLEIIVRANTVLVRAAGRAGPATAVLTARPHVFLRVYDGTPGTSRTFEVLPHTIFGSLYYQPACEYHHGFRSLADKILKVVDDINV